MTDQQKHQQCDGPHMPQIMSLRAMLKNIPTHHEVRAISINAQADVVVVETVYEGMNQHHVFTGGEK